MGIVTWVEMFFNQVDVATLYADMLFALRFCKGFLIIWFWGTWAGGLPNDGWQG